MAGGKEVLEDVGYEVEVGRGLAFWEHYCVEVGGFELGKELVK